MVFVSWVPEVVISSQDADRLQRLAKTHVITQDPVQLVFVQEGEPINSILQKDKESQWNLHTINISIHSLRFLSSIKTILISFFPSNQPVAF